MTLEGLTGEDARVLLSATVPGHLDDRVRDRIIAETRGNPLGLLELPRGMNASELAGGYAVPSSKPLSGQLHDSYVRRVRALPGPTQRLMLLAAADPTGDATLAVAGRAGAVRGSGRGRAGRPRAAARDRFAGPFPAPVGALGGVCRGLGRGPGDRAPGTRDSDADAERDPERRVWHLAVAATGPDEGVATELERTGDCRAGASRAGRRRRRSSSGRSR